MFERLSEIAERIAGPIQLLVASVAASGALLFDVGRIVSQFGASDKTEEYRFWILAFLLGSLSLLIVLLVSKLLVFFSSAASQRSSKAQALSHDLSDQAEVVLALLEVQRPDYVDLLSSHMAVRELRRLGFIEMSMVISGGELQSFGLTESGKVRSGKSKFLSPTQKRSRFCSYSC